MQAKDTCPNLFEYDVTISNQQVKLISEKQQLFITKQGEVELNGKKINLNNTLTQQAINHQDKIRKTFASIEKDAKGHLANLNTQFTGSINRQLGKGNTLLPYLESLYQNLLTLLSQSVKTENNITTFNYKHFVKFTDDGQSIAQKTLFGILGNSIKNMSLIKSYTALRNLAKKEWREQKEALKGFQQETCLTLNNLESEQSRLVKSFTSNQNNWLK